MNDGESGAVRHRRLSDICGGQESSYQDSASVIKENRRAKQYRKNGQIAQTQETEWLRESGLLDVIAPLQILVR